MEDVNQQLPRDTTGTLPQIRRAAIVIACLAGIAIITAVSLFIASRTNISKSTSIEQDSGSGGDGEAAESSSAIQSHGDSATQNPNAPSPSGDDQELSSDDDQELSGDDEDRYCLRLSAGGSLLNIAAFLHQQGLPQISVDLDRAKNTGHLYLGCFDSPTSAKAIALQEKLGKLKYQGQHLNSSFVICKNSALPTASGRKFYYLRIIKLSDSKEVQKKIFAIAEFMRQKQVPELRVRCLTNDNGQRFWVVYAGKFESRHSPDALAFKKKIHECEYQGKRQFAGAYYISDEESAFVVILR